MNGQAFQFIQIIFILYCFESIKATKQATSKLEATTTSKNSATTANAKSTLKLWSRINLPRNHMPYYFNSNPKLRKKCLSYENCPYKEEAAENATKCWGYEPKCSPKDRLFLVQCPEDSRGWVSLSCKPFWS
jgi:hypothetical protein